MPKHDVPNLSPRQVKAKEALDEAFNEIKLWEKYKPHEIEEMWDDIKHDWRVYERAIRGAIRAGLIDHPLVKEWAKSRRLLGQRDALRRVKGLEKGVKRPILMEDLKLWDRIRQRAERHARENEDIEAT